MKKLINNEIQIILHGTKSQKYDVINQLNPIDKNDKHGRTALMYAAKTRDLLMVDTLLRYNADVNIKDNSGNTALSYAAETPYSAAMILLLYRFGANPNTCDELGRTPLIIASSAELSNVISLCSNPDINLNIITINSETALTYAIVWKKRDIVRYLLKIGVDYKWRDKAGYDALYYAKESKSRSIEKMLLKLYESEG